MRIIGVLVVVLMHLALQPTYCSAQGSKTEQIKSLEAEQAKLEARLKEIAAQLEKLKRKENTKGPEAIRLLYFTGGSRPEFLTQKHLETDKEFAKRITTVYGGDAVSLETFFANGQRKEIKKAWPTTQQEVDLKFLHSLQTRYKEAANRYEELVAWEQSIYDLAKEGSSAKFRAETLLRVHRDSYRLFKSSLAVIEVTMAQVLREKE